jgi:hypothetical protein
MPPDIVRVFRASGGHMRESVTLPCTNYSYLGNEYPVRTAQRSCPGKYASAKEEANLAQQDLFGLITYQCPFNSVVGLIRWELLFDPVLARAEYIYVLKYHHAGDLSRGYALPDVLGVTWTPEIAKIQKIKYP